MEKLLITLEAQHRGMEIIAQEIDAAITAKDASLVSSRLEKLRTSFEAHLTLEQARFYPVFEAAEREGRGSAEVARLFAKNMRLIGEGLGRFFDRYAAPPEDLSRFEKDWRGTAYLLAGRIASEEKTLHPMFQSLRG